MAISELTVWPFYDGGIAVDVFIMLSGFVITLLVKRRPEPYGGYIFRRLMRLYPLYLIALGLGIATQGFGPPAFAPVLFGHIAPPGWYPVVHGMALIPHLALHITMLNGVIPNSLLPSAATAFSGPLWSISLEWQFYLIAPFLIALLDFTTYRRATLAAATMILIVGLQIAVGRLWHGDAPAFLPLRLFVFAVGVISGQFWDEASRAPLWKVAAAWAGLIGLLALANRPWLPYFFWAATYVAAAGHQRCGWLTPVNAVLLARPLRWLGQRSYGVYVLHLPILLTVAALIVVPSAAKLGQIGMFAALLLVFPAVLALAAILYRYVELPVILWAKDVRVEALRPRPRSDQQTHSTNMT